MNLLIKFPTFKIASKKLNDIYSDNQENEYFADNKDNIKEKKLLVRIRNFLFYFIYYLLKYNNYFIFFI